MRLEWQQNTQRRYESGVDQGVLYPKEGPGVPWNGLISVEETSVGGEVEAYHFDGIKYLEKRAPKHFQAAITAFSTPKEFASCVGELSVVPGFILTRQPRQQFGFSYRTLINGGDDYKIHIVYNATATPESRGYSSISADVSATNFSWKVDAVPPLSSTFRPSAHFVLDSTKTDLFTLRAVEDILYGTAVVEPRLPSPEELVDIVGLWAPKLIVPAVDPQEQLVNLQTNPDLETDEGIYSYAPNASYSKAAGIARLDWAGSGGGGFYTLGVPATPGVSYSVIARIRSNRSVSMRNGIEWIDTGTGNMVSINNGPSLILPANVWFDLYAEGFVCPAGANRLRQTLYINDSWVSGDVLEWDQIAAYASSTLPSPTYFDGDTPDNLEYSYEWTGTPHASSSARKTQSSSRLIPGLGDLTPSRTPGIYRDLPTTRLAETTVGGLYRLE